MPELRYILATAGHVDHGKSSLVKALTGIDPDRLPEERARGITIDLGFAHLDLPHPSRADTRFKVGIVDVPGHEDFVKNMVAGVGAIDLALLAVAADDGWMPQTEEHLQILEYLGVRRGLIALTKVDLAPDQGAAALAAIRDRLTGSALAEAPIVTTATRDPASLSALAQKMAVVLADTPPPRDIGKPRLPVDRAFSLRGIGTVITGTLTGGHLAKGQEVVILPAGKKARIRAIQSHNKEIDVAYPGTRTALSIPEVNLAADGLEGVKRGDVVTTAEFALPAETIDVLLERSTRLRGEKGAARPLKHGTIVRLHHGSTHLSARVHLHESSSLPPGQSGLAQLRLERPAAILEGERFVLRDWGEQFTLAGGVVLSRDRAASAEEQLAYLRARAAGATAKDAVCAVLARERFTVRADLLRYSTFSRAEIEGAGSSLQNGETHGEFLVRSDWWKELRQRVIAWLADCHRAHPQERGVDLAKLRSRLGLAEPRLVDFLVADLCRDACHQARGVLALKTHVPALPPQLRVAGERIRAQLQAQPLDPPSRNVLAPDPASRQALKFLIESGEVAELSADVMIGSSAYDGAAQIVRAFLRQNDSATASQLRQALGSSRRIVVPLLERLDREGVTRREGDLRRLRSA